MGRNNLSQELTYCFFFHWIHLFQCVCPQAILSRRMKPSHLTNHYVINPVISNWKSFFSNMTFCQVNRQLCNSFLCSNGHVQASACLPFLYQQQCLKTVIEVITVIQPSSNLPRKSVMGWNDGGLLQFLSTLKWLLATVAGGVLNAGTLNSCVAAVEPAAPPCSALQSRMQCFLPLLRFKQWR